MKFTCTLTFLLAAAFSYAQTPDEQQILDIEVKRSDAIANHDRAFLSSLYDERFHGITALGVTINKQELLDILDSNNPHVVFGTEEMKASIHGDAAVLTGKLISKSKSSGHVLGQTRFIHVYVKRTDGWRILEAQATVIH